MRNALVILNLAGVLALGALCVAQWRAELQLQAGVTRFEALSQERAAQLEEKDRLLQGHVADLTSLRDHVTRLAQDLQATKARLAHAERQSAKLAVERDQLRESVGKWTDAVDARDAQVRAAHIKIQDLVARCNDAVQQLNTLSTNHQAAVALLNERTAAYNELVSKMNTQARAQK